MPINQNPRQNIAQKNTKNQITRQSPKQIQNQQNNQQKFPVQPQQKQTTPEKKDMTNSSPQNISSPISGIPIGVKIISIIHYISAAIMAIGASLFLSTGFGWLDFESTIGTSLDLSNAILFTSGIIMIAFVALHIILGRGLWKGKNWTRIFTIILAVIGVIGAIFGMIWNGFDSTLVIIGNSIGIILGLWIAIYLLLNKKVKTAFGSDKPLPPTTNNTEDQTPTQDEKMQMAKINASKVPYHAPPTQPQPQPQSNQGINPRSQRNQ